MSNLRSTPLRAAYSNYAAAILLAAMFAALHVVPASGHEGHDHGPPSPSLPATVKPRIALHSESYELVAIATGGGLALFLDRYATNEPVVDADISVAVAGVPHQADARPDGSYYLVLPALGQEGRHELIFTIAHKDGDDLLAGELVIADPRLPAVAVARPEALPGAKPWYDIWSPIAGVTLLIGLAAGFALGTRAGARRRPAGVAVVATALALGLGGSPRAHEGHGHSPAPAADSLTGDIPRRLPDGSVFLPKPSQRLLTVRSQIALETEAMRAVRLVGRIIADPNRAGLVQSIAGGRVAAPEGGLPRLGQRVARGEVLASVTPALPLADQSTLADKQRELEGALELARQRVGRLGRLGGTSTPRGQIEDIEREIATLELRLGTLRSAKVRPEVLEAPVDGVIASSRAIAGQVVQAQDVLFQILDPAHLWVEALVFGALAPEEIVEASATLPDGTALALDYRGRGSALQTQAVAIQLAIRTPPANVAIGTPVTVLARRAERVKGFLLPRDAVVRGAGGDAIVWQHLDPERFVARPVRMEPFDGVQVLITAGIQARDRIVVHAAELLSQVR